MKKRILLITLILSIIYLIYIFCCFYGYTRVVELYVSSPKKYIENYSSLEKADKNERVVLNILVNNNQLDKVKPYILSILDQTTKVNDINILVKGSLRNIIIPDYLKKVGHIYSCNECLNNVLAKERDADTKLIFIKANKVYKKNFIEEIVDFSNKNPNLLIHYNRGKYSAYLVKPKFFSDFTNLTEWMRENPNRILLVEYNNN